MLPREFLRRYLPYAILAAIAPLASHLAFGQSSASREPPCRPILRRAKPITPAVGWAVVALPSDRPPVDSECTREHLYWTDDNGQTWSDITPPSIPTRSIDQVFFLDRSHGWLFSSEPNGDDPNAHFYLLSTDDGGKSWRTFDFQRSAYQLTEYTGPDQIFFVDPNHGWIHWHWRMMSSSGDPLFATTDGGRSWRRLPDAPGAGPFQFISPKDGWMIGGPVVFQGIPDSENEELWATHDGGEHWKAIPVPFPEKAPERILALTDLHFTDAQHGILTGETSISGYSEKFLTAITRNGGRTWKFSSFEGYRATPSFVGTHVIWSLVDFPAKQSSIRKNETVITSMLSSGFVLGEGLGGVEFLDDSNGWTTYANGQKTLVAISGPTFALVDLLSTSDGGKTLKIITPPSAAQSQFSPPELFVVNGTLVLAARRPTGSLAFLPRPNTKQMTTLGNREPFFSPGESMSLQGTGFLLENTIWFGPRAVSARSADGENLQLVVPQDLPLGIHAIFVENAHGKTNAANVLVGIRKPCKDQ